MRTTVGRLLVNNVLPADMRDYNRVLDKAGLSQLMQDLAKRHPEDYADVVQALHGVGGVSAYTSGHSISLEALRSRGPSPSVVHAIQNKVDAVMRSRGTDKEKADRLTGVMTPYLKDMEKATLEGARSSGSPLADQVDSGARGNATQLNTMVGAPMMVMDAKDRPVPIPVTHNFAQGLSPAEYWATAHGTRKGAIGVKLSTAETGYFSKQISLAMHHLHASDAPLVPGLGLPVASDDPDNEGSVLARDAGPHRAGTVITAAMVRDLPKYGKEVLVRSPISDISPDGGIPREAIGIRERGTMPDVGENVGVSAGQSITERLSQKALGSKHVAGMGGKRSGGFRVVNQLAQVPEVYPNGAAHASVDGRVTDITDAPQGGKYVEIGDRRHYVDTDQIPTVKVGDQVEAGDVLSDGLPNPAMVVKHKGIGEGRRYFMDTMRDVLKASGIDVNRRNVELMARSLVNHVEVLDESPSMPGALPGDITEYDRLAGAWTPREGSLEMPTRSSVGTYLEEPVLHFSIGTRVTPNVCKKLEEHGIKRVTTHVEPPPFVPYMNRAATNTLHDPDWMMRLGGGYARKGFLDSVHRGLTSDTSGSSYIPKLVTGVADSDED